MLALAFVTLLPLVEPPPAPVQPVDFDSTMEDVGDGISSGWKFTKRGVGSMFGMGEETLESYVCSDPNFHARRQEEEATGDISWLLEGTLRTPGDGYQHRFTFLGAQGADAYMTLQLGQPLRPVNNGWAGQLRVSQKFNIHPPVRMLHIRVEGLTAQPYEMLCDVSAANRLKK